MGTTSALRYIPALDGLRGIAIISVALYHGTAFLKGGWVGVDIFFVLSGYLITRVLIEQYRQLNNISFKSFYIKRILRLLPALIILLLVMLVFTPYLPGRLGLDAYSIAIAGLYLMDLSKAFGWHPDSPLDHTWSLAIEEQFYVLWPICLLTLLRLKRSALWPALAIVVILGWRSLLVLLHQSDARTYHSFDVRSDGLLIGCFIAMAPWSNYARKTAVRYAFIPLLSLIAIVIAMEPQPLWVRSIGFTAVPLLAGWLLLIALQPGSISRALSNLPLTYTGQISYGWYLWHWPILVIGRAVLTPFRGEGVILVATAYVVAMASFHFVERPFLRMKTRFEPQTSASGMLETSPIKN